MSDIFRLSQPFIAAKKRKQHKLKIIFFAILAPLCALLRLLKNPFVKSVEVTPLGSPNNKHCPC
jgi:hypothetical protein